MTIIVTKVMTEGKYSGDDISTYNEVRPVPGRELSISPLLTSTRRRNYIPGTCVCMHSPMGVLLGAVIITYNQPSK